MEGLISVIVPCYNQAEFLEECLTSVLNQTYSNWECIIINDGSADLTEEVAKKWTKNDKRFKYIYQENKGLSSARNTGLAQAKGEYIQFLDSDDFLDQEKFLKSIKEFSKPQVDIVISDFILFNEATNSLENPYCVLGEHQFNLDSILFEWGEKFSIPIHCALIKSKVLIGYSFPTELKAREDWSLWVFLYKSCIVTIFINEPLAYYRQHDMSLTKNFRLMSLEKIKAIGIVEQLISKEKSLKLYKNHIQEISKEYTVLQNRYFGVLNSRTYRLACFFKNNLISLRKILNRHSK
ncbi:glycosyltransferase family 2 protein [Leeuwenhoekiella polynyae]|uniref:Glycosyltransferase 2-like domain-containing protein n=1 Tax=Leeuwenhoekiella polynyae TaxID=1550906 RepID=A0A4Q0PEB0_9FLAO|nr:glycosyltransferase family 2 protein [Leeuwenhoekiella polynyae]RXG25185.1 hypothetical protein DSM02_1155 [Leeuwenhoekiella polynyae]